MKTLLFLLAFLPLSLMGQETKLINPIENYGVKVDEITYEDSTGFYMIRFTYNDEWCMIPATYPPGSPHYDSGIEVFQVIDGKRTPIGESFSGTYTKRKCYEDEPGYLIRKARVMADPELKKRYEKQDYEDPVWDYINGKITLTDILHPLSFNVGVLTDSLKFQADTTKAQFNYGSGWWTGLSTLRVGTGIDKPVTDTVAVWMLCAEMDDRGLPSYNITMKGWEVRKFTGNQWIGTGEDLMVVSTPIYNHVCYLNYFKHPLTGYIVWQTREVK